MTEIRGFECSIRPEHEHRASTADNGARQDTPEREATAAGAELTLRLTDVEILVGNLYCARPAPDKLGR